MSKVLYVLISIFYFPKAYCKPSKSEKMKLKLWGLRGGGGGVGDYEIYLLIKNKIKILKKILKYVLFIF